MGVPTADARILDRDFAVDWYAGWIEAWNSNKPQLCDELLTEDFVLDSPTTRHTGWSVRGPAAAKQYIGYVLNAYPDLCWEVIAPPLFSDDAARAAFGWRGTGHFSGRLDPPGGRGHRPCVQLRRAGGLRLPRRPGLLPQRDLRPARPDEANRRVPRRHRR